MSRIGFDSIINVKKIGLENFLVPISVKVELEMEDKYDGLYNIVEKNVLLSLISKTIECYIKDIENGLINTSYSKVNNTNDIFLGRLKESIKDNVLIKHSLSVKMQFGGENRGNYLEGISSFPQNINIYN